MSTKESKDHCSGDYPALWRIPYNYTQDIIRRVPYTKKVERIGSRKASEFFDVVAITPALALAAWDKEYGYREKYKEGDRFGVKREGEPTFICYVDACIEVYRK